MSTLTKKQVKTYGPRTDAQLVRAYGAGAQLTATVRHDDSCGNGHNTFSVTGEVMTTASRMRKDIEAGGCLHDDISRLFPELAPAVKWHLTSTDGPMHYIQNTVYWASGLDHWGRAKGAPSSWEYRLYVGTSPIGHSIDGKFAKFISDRMLAVDFWTFTPPEAKFHIQAFAHDRDPKTYGTHYSLLGLSEKWSDAPFRHERAAQEFAEALNTCTVRIEKTPTAFSEGKDRDLPKARAAAVWPDATDEDLIAPGLKERLEARLPALMAEFRAVVESLGFTY